MIQVQGLLLPPAPLVQLDRTISPEDINVGSKPTRRIHWRNRVALKNCTLHSRELAVNAQIGVS